MLGTPLGSVRTSSPLTIGASHHPSAGTLLSCSTVDPSITQIPGAQPGFVYGSTFSSATSLPLATPFPGTFSMWSSPQIGNTLSQQTHPVQNQEGHASFILGSVGQFHPESGGFSPFPSGNFNPNPTPRNSTGLPFGWNWNVNNSLGFQNLGLAYTGSSSQQLGTNPPFGPIGSTTPLGKPPSIGQPSVTPQTNVGAIPHSIQMQGGTMGPSPLPLGQVPPLSQFQQMGGSNVPLNPSMSYGQGHP